jgi:uncharacterized protein
MSWIEDSLGTVKPVIAMCHFKALPGDPGYDPHKGLSWIVEQALADLESLQEGGVDAVMFSNESSLPYLTKVEPITTAVMARIIGEISDRIRIPFGVNVLWDGAASLELAVATGAVFVREIYSGVYASDFGLWNTTVGATARHKMRIHGSSVKQIFNIMPEAAVYLAERDIQSVARSTVFNCRPDALCVSGLTAGAETSAGELKKVKEVVPDTLVFANTGVNLGNIEEQLAIADGVIAGTTFKRDGYIWNEVETQRVKRFMEKVRSIRGGK